ncbi:hypothetical protein [Rubellimicrobium aerolatum]|uniref:Uncharacterized protein n=1 Tax=Rubellimicrobium aerolatum TaxID=490979 RepID=A0ABW0SFE7_9RHOB|nr:hypothetical protein [Rubellimicrobium aerolatum]MBP1807249.1 hypothetical protein [Rubellimicrobium aerolatum]
MRLFDRLAARRAPVPPPPCRDAAELRAALLALDEVDGPLHVRDGRPEDADLTAEWRLADPRWSCAAAESGVARVAQFLLRLDPRAAEVRVVQRDFEIGWRAGAPTLSFAAPDVRAWRLELGHGAFPPGRFDTRELARSLREVAAIHGWAWRPVVFGRL